LETAKFIDSKDVAEILVSEGLSTLRSVAHEPGEGGGEYFALLTVKRNKQNRQHPSNNKLRLIKLKASALGIKIQFILNIDGEADLEVDVRATLTANYEPFVRNAYCSFHRKNAFVWIDQKRPIPSEVLANIAKTTKEIIRLSGFTLVSISTLQNSNIPSKLAILKTIRQLAPTTLEGLEEILREKEFAIPSDHWLNHQLDKLRKHAEVVRNKSGRYSLTALTLKSLGTTKNRQSPDIERLLALAYGKH
jgi:hypothetical protein